MRDRYKLSLLQKTVLLPKDLATDLNIILDYQNKCRSQLVAKMSKFFTVLLFMFEFPNYFYGSTKLYLDLHLAKFLNTSAKSFFPCTIYKANVM